MSLPPVRSITLRTGEATFLKDGRDGHGTIVLLHGGGLDCATLSWRHLFPALIKTRLVIAPNWPGYAGTAPFARTYRIADLGAWLIDFLDALDIEHSTLIGVSMGGGAALWSALHHPDRVDALVPVGTYGLAQRVPHHLMSYLLTKLPLNAVSYAVMRRSRWALRQALQAIFADPDKVSHDILMEVREVLSAAGTGEAFSQFQRGEMTPRGLRTILTAQLPQITQPTLFIHGKADSLVPIADIRQAASTLQNARFEAMDAGHWPMRERPKEFNAIVTAFLDTLPTNHTT
ncbi:MAG: alpha/beta hydrolase [Pseudomonadota bacterium]